MNERDIYSKIDNEISSNNLDRPTWLKALQNSNGSENQAKALYIKYRFDIITEDGSTNESKKYKKELENEIIKPNGFMLPWLKIELWFIRFSNQIPIFGKKEISGIDYFLSSIILFLLAHGPSRFFTKWKGSLYFPDQPFLYSVNVISWILIALPLMVITLKRLRQINLDKYLDHIFFVTIATYILIPLYIQKADIFWFYTCVNRKGFWSRWCWGENVEYFPIFILLSFLLLFSIKLYLIIKPAEKK